jgi:hypothetical protein
MMKPTIDELIARSAPPTGAESLRVQAMIRALAEESRAAVKSSPRSPGRRLWWLVAPLLAVPAIAFATTAGTEPRMVPDFSIPVNYTTDTGTAVSCSIDLFNMEINYVELTTPEVEYLRAQDWTGVGQRIYDAALAHEGDRAWWQAATVGWPGGATSDDVQLVAWQHAVDENIFDLIPDGITPTGTGYGVTDQCTGELH